MDQPWVHHRTFVILVSYSIRRWAWQIISVRFAELRTCTFTTLVVSGVTLLQKPWTKSLVHAFIMSRLDYGNALLAGLPLEHLKKLQRIQNIAARIITFTPRRDHITPILRQLHWLPIKRRIEFKILLHVFRCINGTAPLYLADMLKRQCSTGRTRSSQQHLLEVPRTKLVSFGDRSFKVVGPRLWNALPIAIKRIVTVPLFVKALKTHIFKEEFCWRFWLFKALLT